MAAAKKISMYPVKDEGIKDAYTISFIPLKRSFFTHFLWKEKRTFSKCEAWLDLIQRARFEQSQVSELIGGRLIKWSRGQLPASVRFLASQWNWSNHKVDDFLNMLERENMIAKDLLQGQTVITLLNYEAHNGEKHPKGHVKSSNPIGYNDVGDGEGTGGNTEHSKKHANKGQQRGHINGSQPTTYEQPGDSKRDTEGTLRGHGGNETNKDNKENKEEVSSGASAQLPGNFKNWTKEDFKKAVSLNKTGLMATGQAQQNICFDFFNYWTEPNPKGVMKFQLQQTWDTLRRLQNWENRDLKK